MKPLIVASLALLMLPGVSFAASKKKVMQFWNLTGETLTEVSLAPAGTKNFGPNQCKNDKDGSVDFDEELAITDVTPGRYDLRLTDDKGRVCFAKAVEVEKDETFSVRDTELTDCAK
jgi:hypothetical protein